MILAYSVVDGPLEKWEINERVETHGPKEKNIITFSRTLKLLPVGRPRVIS